MIVSRRKLQREMRLSRSTHCYAPVDSSSTPLYCHPAVVGSALLKSSLSRIHRPDRTSQASRQAAKFQSQVQVTLASSQFARFPYSSHLYHWLPSLVFRDSLASARQNGWNDSFSARVCAIAATRLEQQQQWKSYRGGAGWQQ